jgi:hypothetical protein
MTLAMLEQEIRHRLQQSSQIEDVQLRTKEGGSGAKQLAVTRTVHQETRYIEFRECGDETPSWNFSMLLGSYGDATKPPLDARRGGSADYALLNFNKWIVDFCEWADMPRFV